MAIILARVAVADKRLVVLTGAAVFMFGGAGERENAGCLLAACWLLQSGVAAWVSTDAADGKEGVGRQVCSGATGLGWTLDEMVGCPPFFFCLWSVALSVALKRMGPFRRCSATRPRTRWGVGTYWFTGATAADGTLNPHVMPGQRRLRQGGRGLVVVAATATRSGGISGSGRRCKGSTSDASRRATGDDVLEGGLLEDWRREESELRVGNLPSTVGFCRPHPPSTAL